VWASVWYRPRETGRGRVWLDGLLCPAGALSRAAAVMFRVSTPFPSAVLNPRAMRCTSQRPRESAGIGATLRRASSFALAIVGLGSVVSFASFTSAATSVTVESYTPGTISPAGLGTTAYTTAADAKLQDFPRDTGGTTTKFARGLSNNSYASSTILPIGQGGGLTVKFQQPINALAGAKEIGLFTGNFLASSGGFFYGDMEASILVSSDNVTWRTLGGSVVADPATYTAAPQNLNAPTVSYNWGTGTAAWTYPMNGATQATLDAFGLSDYETPMPNDTIYNDVASTNGQRAALNGSSMPADYSAIFGTSAGGNWFDISGSGLASIQYLRLNVAGDAPASVRLDSVFANAAAVPEPGTLVLLGGGLLLALRRRSRKASVGAVVAVAAGLLVPAESARAESLDEITNWTGTGSNRAAMAVYWRSPEVLNSTSVAAPNQTTMKIWGYRFNGTTTAEAMYSAIVAADPKLYAVDTGPTEFGVGLLGFGYDDGDGVYGLTNGTTTYTQANFTNHRLTAGYGAADQLNSTDSGDLYWGGFFGPSWETWTEHGGLGGFNTAPNRGPNPFYTPDGGFGGTHGQWDLTFDGLTSMSIENGSWLGFSVAAGGLDFANPDAPGTVAYNTHKAAPPTVPEPAMIGVLGLFATAALRRIRR
jgi:hypothetical protein